jgi:hypothetical protein
MLPKRSPNAQLTPIVDAPNCSNPNKPESDASGLTNLRSTTMKMKSALQFTVAAALASVMSLSAYAYAPSRDGLDRTVTIANFAPYAIVRLEAINVSHVGPWHTYTQRIKVDDTQNIVIDDGLGYCRFDFHVVYADGNDAWFRDVNVCDDYELDFS